MGRALAAGFVRAGDNVVICARDGERGAEGCVRMCEGLCVRLVVVVGWGGVRWGGGGWKGRGGEGGKVWGRFAVGWAAASSAGSVPGE